MIGNYSGEFQTAYFALKWLSSIILGILLFLKLSEGFQEINKVLLMVMK